MELPDSSPLILSPGHHPLLLSSRPGYLLARPAGRRACDPFVSAMKERGVGLAVVLLTGDEMESFYGLDLCRLYAAAGIETLHYPVVDGSVPEDIASFHRLVRTIHERLRLSVVLVHCNAGLGRTGTVAAGLLVDRGSRWDAAITRVRHARSGSLENRGQEQFIRRYENGIRRGPDGSPDSPW